MKKSVLLLASLFLLSCSPEEVPKDCGCDRIVEVASFTLPDRSVFGKYTTINDCTGVQNSYDWRGTTPSKGSCR